MNILSFVILFLFMLVGAIAHWVKKKLSGEIRGTLVDYFFSDYPGRSVSVLSVFIGTAFTVASTDASGIVDPIMLWEQVKATYTIPSVSWFALGGALSWGWSFDSAVNKGSKSDGAA